MLKTPGGSRSGWKHFSSVMQIDPASATSLFCVQGLWTSKGVVAEPGSFSPKDQKTGRLRICHCWCLAVYCTKSYNYTVYNIYIYTRIRFLYVYVISMQKKCLLNDTNPTQVCNQDLKQKNMCVISFLSVSLPSQLIDIEILSTFPVTIDAKKCQVPSTWMLSWWEMV